MSSTAPATGQLTTHDKQSSPSIFGLFSHYISALHCADHFRESFVNKRPAILIIKATPPFSARGASNYYRLAGFWRVFVEVVTELASWSRDEP